MTTLDEPAKENEHWFRKQIIKMNPEEKKEFISECKCFLYNLNNYSTGERFNRFYNEKRE